MVYSKPLNILVVLALLLFAKGFDLKGEWNFYKQTGQTVSPYIENTKTAVTNQIFTDNGEAINDIVGCISISMNSVGFNFKSVNSALLASTPEFAYGFWVNFESTISTTVFQFGDDNIPHYVVSSTTDGTLKVSYFSDTSTTDSANDFSFTVPLNKWLFIVFHFTDNSGVVTLEVILPGKAPISKTSGTSTVAFALPGGVWYFGKSIKGKFHKVVLAKAATIDSSYNTITLVDHNSNTEVHAAACTGVTCNDSVCPQSFGSLTSGICLSSMQYCTVCDSTGCSTCDPDSARDEATYCTACKADGTTNELKNGHCCVKANNCAECSKKSTQCDVCANGYFLNDDSATSTSCLSCTGSCGSCLPGPNCYTCATTITQTGTTCRVDSFGFEVSIDRPNIVLDFAHPLKTGLSKSSFIATSSSGATIETTLWTIIGCTAGLKQCKIEALNVQESDLPITLDIEFTQA